MTASLAGAPERQRLLSHRQIMAILAGLMAGMFLASLDQTIVSTSIRTIADDLNGLSLQAWVTTAYLITSTLTTPLYGKLSDIYGRKPLFLTAIVLFLIGSILCTFSFSMLQLAGFRALQGLGAGGLFSLSMTILGDIVSPRERAKYQGYLVAVFATSSVLGPLAGGFLAGQAEILGITGWRWVFLVNVPIGAVAMLIVAKVLNLPHQRRHARVDWPGALALAVGLVPLLLVAEQGRTWGWTSLPSLACFVVGLGGLVLFVIAEHRFGDDALLPLRSFRVPAFGVGSAGLLLLGMGMFGGLAALPLYLQIVKGATPTQAGLLTIPLVGGMMIMSLISGQIISRTGRLKAWPVGGIALMVVGLVALATIGVATPFGLAASYMLVFGMGLGASMQPLTLTMQSAMPARDMGMVTGSAMFFRQVGGTLGTAVFLSVLFGSVPSKITSAFSAAVPSPAFQAALTDPSVRANPADQGVLTALGNGSVGGYSLNDTSFIGHLDPRLAEPFLVGYSGAMSLTFLCGVAVLLVALVLVIFLPRVTLRQLSGLEAQAQALSEAITVPVPGAAALPVPESARTGVDRHGVDRHGVDRHGVDRLRDRLLGELLPDPDAALASLAAAERARDNVRSARGELDHYATQLLEARRDLARHGLTEEQIDQLLRLTPAEVTRG